MNKLKLNKGKAMACLILMCLFIIQACKKDSYLPKSTTANKDQQITNISYPRFLSAINIDQTGSLKNVLTANREKLMSTKKRLIDFVLQTDSVKMLVIKDTISYVLAIKPHTPRSIQFQNITIQVANGKTTAFLSTYTPEKEWIDNWRIGMQTKFKGSITFNKIELDIKSESTKTLNKTGIGDEKSGLKGRILASIGNDIAEIPNTLSLLPGECEFYDVYQAVLVPCKYGHMTRSQCDYYDKWQTWELVPGDWPPSYEVNRTSIVNCAMPNLPGGGDGSGGSTTPNPPGNYNPCDGTPQPVPPGGISFEKGTRLMLAAPTDCDPSPITPVEPTIPTVTALQFLLAYLDPTTEEFKYLNNPSNSDVVNTLANYLISNGTTTENLNFIDWATGYLMTNPEVPFKELSDNNTLPITLPNLDTSELNNYPKFKALVNDLPNFLNHYPNILKALSLTTGLTEKRIKELMQPGKGPKVIVVNNLKDADGNDVVGQFDNKNKILKIDNGYVNDLDIANMSIKYQAIGLILTITTLHEFVHFGRDASSLPKRMAGVVTGKGSYEAGWYFEDIITAPGSSRLEPANAQEWLRYYRVKSRQ